MQDHTNYRPAKCHLCEKSFKNKQDLASHIRCHKVIPKTQSNFILAIKIFSFHFQGHSQIYV